MCLYIIEDCEPKEGNPVTDEERLKTFRRAEDWERLAILEVRVDDHESDIKEVVDNQKKLATSIDLVNKTLLQIKYTVIGAIVILVAQEFGWLAVLKAATMGAAPTVS